MSKPFIVGITGGSASGKTSFLRNLLDSFDPSEIALVSQDNYYRPKEQQPVDGQGIANFDLPASIDHIRYANDILTLKSGKSIVFKEYTYNNPEADAKTIEIKPAKLIVVEGIFVFYFEEIVKHLDLKIFIDAKEHIKLSRRIVRDQKERGYDMEDVMYRYTNHVAPAYERYIEPYKYDADIIVPNNSHYKKALEIVVTYLKTI
jgi:uridine kinase